MSHNTPRSLLVKELANELKKRGLSYWLEEWDLVSVIHFSRQSNWRLANATPAWRSLVRIKISAALPCFLCLVVSICSPLTSKAQGTVEAKTNSLPEWRWEAVIAALEDPSIEVQQAAVEWLAALSEQRYAPPQGATSKRLCELLKARLVPTNTDGFYVLRALPWVDPACTGAAPQVADLLTNSDEGLRVAAAEALGSMGPASASFAPQVADLLKGSNPDVRRSAAEALEKLSAQPDPTLALRLIDASKSYQDLRGVLSFWAYLTGGAQEPNRSRVKGRGAP